MVLLFYRKLRVMNSKNVEKQVKDFCAEVFELLSQHDRLDSFKLFRIYRDVRFSKTKHPIKPISDAVSNVNNQDLEEGIIFTFSLVSLLLRLGFGNPTVPI